MAKQKPFDLPKSFLNQMNEFTTGYYMVVCDHNGDLSTYWNFPDSKTELALMNLLRISADAAETYAQENALDDLYCGPQKNVVEDEDEED